MSADDDLERILREGWKRLPEPDGGVTRRARERALTAVPRARPRRRRTARVAALLGVGVVVALGLGVGLGALVAPNGTAARDPIGLGFVPRSGWFALQSAMRGTPDQPAVAMVANVPFAEDDVVNGLAEPSALPYSTLLTLPVRGVVVVATFIEAGQQPWTSTRYPPRTLPLRLRDATPYIEYGTQVRPDEPLGQYQLRALVNGFNVDLVVYAGSPRLSRRLSAEVQQQLDRLVVQRARKTEHARRSRPATIQAPSAPVVLDRTFACTPSLIGGIRKIGTRAHSGSGRHGQSWDQPAFAGIETNVSGAAATAVENELAWVSAGRPSPSATIVATLVGYTFPFRSWGTIGVNRGRCRATRARVSLSRSGLDGGTVGPIDERRDCASGRRILVRIRAVLGSAARLSTFRSVLRTTVPVREATLVARAQSGRPLVYAQVLQSGKSLLYTSPTCFPD